jgi:hypothetical protein
MTLQPQAHAPHGCIDWRVRDIPRPECMGVLMQDINLVLLPVSRQVLMICIIVSTTLGKVKTLNTHYEAVDANSPVH